METERVYRIGEVADMLDLQPYVLRFWEKEFKQLAPKRDENGQRVYSAIHVALLKRIKNLLHEKGMTIDGARRILLGESMQQEKNRSASETLENVKTELQSLYKFLSMLDEE